MPALVLKLDGDHAWPDLEQKITAGQIIELEHIEVALLPGGMSSGGASVAIRLDLPDGRTVIAQTSQALFDSAARAFRARLEYLAELAAKGGASS